MVPLLFIVALTSGDDPPLARGAPFEVSPWALDVKLRSPLLEGVRAPATSPLRFARAQTTSAQTAPAQTAQPVAPMSASTSSAPDAQGGACDIECDACRDADRTARYLYRQRATTLRTHRAFALAALGSLAVTEVIGTIMLYNQPTWFGIGNCRNPGHERDFGCESPGTLAGVHEGLAFLTMGLYTTAAILAIAAPDPDDAASGSNSASRTLRVHKVMAWVHGTGMVLMPILGILAANPQAVGVSPDATGDFQRGMRTVHAIVGYSTLVALTTAAVLEF